MAAILAHIQIKPGKEAFFEATVQTLYAQSHAEEQHLLRYEYWRGQKPGLYYCLLSFTDYAGFMAHQTSAHHEAAIPALSEALQSIDLEWIDPVPGAADAPPTIPMALGEAASALAKAYAQQIAVRVAGWWRAP
ncbi:MAG: antibiotic biosynthesis monooxygenase [Hyphomonadaceae bacterium]|nr:antibiotic biosynthesis monooxygenase [Hyphomonadaceae bacterium]